MNPDRSLLEGLADAVHSLGALDLVGLLVLLLFLVLGFVNGFVGQSCRLLALALGILVARAGEPHLAPVVGSLLPAASPAVRTGIAYAVLFLLVLLATSLLALLGKKAVEALRLGLLDRIAGAGLGLVTGAVVHFAVLVCVILLVKEERVGGLAEGSRSLRAAFAIAEVVRPALPPQARVRIEAARARVEKPPEPLPAEGTPDPGR